MIDYIKEKVPIKYLLGIEDYPTLEGILYELMIHMNENKKDTFSKTDLSLYVKTRVSDNIDNDIEELIQKGYIKQMGKRTYMIINVPWK